MQRSDAVDIEFDNRINGALRVRWNLPGGLREMSKGCPRCCSTSPAATLRRKRDFVHDYLEQRLATATRPGRHAHLIDSPVKAAIHVP